MDIKHHASEDVLERFVMGTLSNGPGEQLEKHLLLCQSCRDRLNDTEEFVIATRTAAAETTTISARSFRFTHDTDDGLIVSEVTRVRRGKWLAHHWGPQLDGGRTMKTLPEAISYLLESFQQMFPIHRCGERCQTGQTRSAPPTEKDCLRLADHSHERSDPYAS